MRLGGCSNRYLIFIYDKRKSIHYRSYSSFNGAKKKLPWLQGSFFCTIEHNVYLIYLLQ